eukprot:CAMPEP_0202875694 /NCGR_PEP_ID=MMETSP1391-20130828/27757_1 /ASSEMBLY_ACC=CAM_ASM_000867 /TAXON_ID=1034604 /ORGANISM="Chlamydomonas leiostraca, Strain SAG 11-49" /LENGTH=80 /DNA_ID=CAMNT_0049557413 /DNA_START=589 /DNA_END=831 /DNA_ORIENTATION=+
MDRTMSDTWSSVMASTLLCASALSTVAASRLATASCAVHTAPAASSAARTRSLAYNPAASMQADAHMQAQPTAAGTRISL